MNRKRDVLVLTMLPLLGSHTALAQEAQKTPRHPMSFFITSVGMGDGANLGGLRGADAHCQKLAAASVDRDAGKKTWHAYLSTQGPGAVNARDRIGQGPWYNIEGERIAQNLADLHGDTAELARVGNNLTLLTGLNEKDNALAGAIPRVSQHNILTGSRTDGRAYTDDKDHTCKNWTSNGAGAAQLGHSDRTGGANKSWNSAHPSQAGCSQNALSNDGAGFFYCFAIN